MSQIDLSTMPTGRVGGQEPLWFSDLYYSAVQQNFTGGVRIKGEGDCCVFFRSGRPVHTAGAQFEAHFIGDILVSWNLLTQEALEEAIHIQRTAPGKAPLLGAILISHSGVNPDDVKRAVRAQNEARFEELFAVEGDFQAAPGENAHLREVGVLSDPWVILLTGLKQFADARELRNASDALLGKAIKVRPGPLPFPTECVDELDRSLIQLLEKPRKPDQLERSLSDRRRVRAWLRALILHDRLEIGPANIAIPIPRATLLKGQVNMSMPDSADLPPGRSQTTSEGASDTDIHEHMAKVKKKAGCDPARAREIKAFHERSKEKQENYFELFDLDPAQPDLDATKLRKRYTELAKKFHPDSFGGDVSEEIAVQLREITGRLNDAYSTLSDPDKLVVYRAALADVRIKGNMQRADLIRDGQLKAQMGVVMIRKKRFHEAREFLSYAVQCDPTDTQARVDLAQAMLQDAHYPEASEKAEPHLREAVAAQPENYMAWYGLGLVKKRTGKSKEALSHFQKALQMNPQHPESRTEVRLLEKRLAGEPDKGTKPKSGLGKLFNR
jgi:tetratricopeptide (TPR) repeat protein